MLAHYKSWLPKAWSAGLEVEELRSLQEFFDDGTEAVHDYERVSDRPLPAIPPRLLGSPSSWAGDLVTLSGPLQQAEQQERRRRA
jgi:hypothetical protein